MDEEYRQLLLKQQYRLYKNHAAVKLCHWMRQSLLYGRNCYKQDFYGIKSHRCLQMSPAINQCDHMCVFCWREQGHDFDVDEWAEPSEMLDALIEYQRKLITGFNGDPRCDTERYVEAQNPNMVALSLAGEPVLYPYISDLLKECHRRGMVTFLVTNGVNPKVLEEMDVLPRQLYVTVAAPNKEVYQRVCRPKRADGWENLMQTLELLPSLDTRKVIRHTLVKGFNLGWEEEYARLDKQSGVEMVEAKGYVFVGGSRQRLSLANMPSHEEIVNFSERLASLLGMETVKEKADSRVVLLSTPGVETRII
ncbi:MAG: tRNA wybutosine-synthesizing protein 1 [Candidatus Methanomethylophilaceae archaeon]|nr:tRNA wybutosine-synthesizing protein 1 [Candidatus Methanomethylophilaceae archaeon]MDI3542258.1 tRNA wybutosine-synthesizing protein 1 [Candidatus Methanomethylophilaceae archaeon]HIJ00398.1 4-demethylwyosine synthase TYW1 [Candidatus Methanomethylophilaceae archaeon]